MNKSRLIIEIKNGLIISAIANSYDIIVEVIDRDIPESPTDAYVPDIKTDLEMDAIMFAADRQAVAFILSTWSPDEGKSLYIFENIKNTSHVPED